MNKLILLFSFLSLFFCKAKSQSLLNGCPLFPADWYTTYQYKFNTKAYANDFDLVTAQKDQQGNYYYLFYQQVITDYCVTPDCSDKVESVFGDYFFIIKWDGKEQAKKIIEHQTINRTFDNNVVFSVEKDYIYLNFITYPCAGALLLDQRLSAQNWSDTLIKANNCCKNTTAIFNFEGQLQNQFYGNCNNYYDVSKYFNRNILITSSLGCALNPTDTAYQDMQRHINEAIETNMSLKGMKFDIYQSYKRGRYYYYLRDYLEPQAKERFLKCLQQYYPEARGHFHP